MDNIAKNYAQQGIQKSQAATHNIQTFHLSNGAVESLKWLALLAMVVDHVNAVFFSRELGELATVIGRLAMPLFSVVLGYNLARPGADLARCLRRLLLFGALALPAHAYLFAQVGGWWPLNIMLTFAVAVGTLLLLERRDGWGALLVFVGGGGLVEYWWPGVGLVLVSYGIARGGLTPWRLFALAWIVPGLCFVSGSPWALLAFPVIGLASLVAVPLPRLRWAFWWFYPAHLAALVVGAVLIG